MRTTLTLDDDVAARLKRLRQHGQFKDLVNQALRAGLEQLERKASPTRHPYRLRPVRLKPRRSDLDNIAEVLAETEGDAHP
jgi:Arc/MetJ family transcription regulator